MNTHNMETQIDHMQNELFNKYKKHLRSQEIAGAIGEAVLKRSYELDWLVYRVMLKQHLKPAR